MTTEPDDLEQLKRALVALKKMRARVDELEQARTEPVAIVGIGCRLPGGANTPDAYWRLLRDGVNAIISTPLDRWDGDAYYAANADEPGKAQTRYGGFIAEVDRFDPHLFGIAPREAAAMDPQQRLILEVAWEALEDAGIAPERLAGSQTGVFVGIGLNDYGRIQVPAQVVDSRRIDNYTLSGNALCITANRLSYLLDLHGPSMAIDTACSSSLVAIHQACSSLRSGESTVALVGGVNLMLAPDTTIGVSKFLAPDGACKFGDARADGYVRGEGALVVVLKTLAQARAAGDSIYAIIRGSAVNQDGYSSGLTVPNGVAQEAVLRTALRNAGVAPAEIDYVEAHGTGTALGDPIELNALHAVLSEQRAPREFCAVGSVKTNIGHLEAGAGLAGLVKVALALKHGEIPPSLHFETPNPHIPFDEMCLRVQRTLTPWGAHDRRPLAGVSSFGFGGTNAHVVLQAAPPEPERAEQTASLDRPRHVLALSARGEAALAELAARYRDHLAAHRDLAIQDVTHSANTGRSHLSHRLALMATTTAEMQGLLASVAAGEMPGGVSRGAAANRTRPRIALLFTGQGSQYVGMGRQLYATQPLVREWLDRCDAALRGVLEPSLLTVMFEPTGRLDETAYTQPALFALEYALAKLWQSWGIEPGAVMGHSVGEYVAACLAGVFSLEEGLLLIAARGRLMQALPAGGAMVAVLAGADRVTAAVARAADAVSIAAFNGPDNTVLSGAADRLDAIVAELRAQRIQVRPLKVSHAFHSPLMEPMLAEFERAAQIEYRAPQLTLISNVTGRPMREAPDAAYWREHVRTPVQFAASMQALDAQGYDTFVEVGPSPTLLGMGKRCIPDHGALWLSSLRSGHDEWEQVLASLGELYVHGAAVDWTGFDRPYVRTRVSLPTYPFARERYWFAQEPPSGSRAPAVTRSPGSHPLLSERLDSPALQGVPYQSVLSRERVPFLDDHRVYGTMVLPATAYAEMVLASAGIHTVLDELIIQAPLTIPDDGERTVQLVLNPAGESETGRTFQVFSRDAAAGSGWKLHAGGKLHWEPSSPMPSGAPSLAEAQSLCATEIDVDGFQATLKAQGLEYGPRFRGMVRLWQGTDAALAEIRLPEQDAAAEYRVHPALLDACLQTLGAQLPKSASQAWLPVSWEKLRVYGAVTGPVWSYATIRARARDRLTASLYVFDQDGVPVLEIERVDVRPADRAALYQAMGQVAPAQYADWLYTVDWQPKPLAAQATRLSQQSAVSAAVSGEREPGPQDTRAVSLVPGNWLILADRGGVGVGLADRLRARGETCDLVEPGEAFVELGRNRWQVNPTARTDFQRLVQATAPERGVIHLWGLEPNESRSAAMQLSGASALHLVQALAARGPARLWFVTRGTQAVPGTTSAVDVANASLWGFARTASAELAELEMVCIDLDLAMKDQNQALFDNVWQGDGEDQVALRGDARYVARLAPLALQDMQSGSVPVRDGAGDREPLPVRLEITQRGMLDNLEIKPVARAGLGAGEIEIRVAATGVNFRDVLNALGMYPGDAGLLGHECAGTVVAVGDGVRDLRPGDRVMAVATGSYATYVTTPAALAVRVPERLTDAQAATLPITFLTASYALDHLARIGRGDRVLIHAAAGGVGLAAVQIARRAGAEIYATAGNAEKRAYLSSLGVRHLFNSRTLDFAGEIMAATNGAGVDVVLNSLADEFIPKSLGVLRTGGALLEIGKRGIWEAERVAALGKGIRYSIIDVGTVCEQDPQLIQGMLRALVAAVDAGTLSPLPLKTFALAQAPAAFRYMAQAHHIGKIVITQDVVTPHSPSAAGPGMENRAEAAVGSEGTYLITGGMGGLGLAVARGLAEWGARSLVLAGRTRPTPAAEQAIREIEGQGARVTVLQADVAQTGDVARILAEIDAHLPRLRGIIHAAGVLDDGVIPEQTWKRFECVMAPKIDGAWELHEQTRSRSLEFFVLFSAGATLLGSPGQSNYAAANALLDALAHHRRAQGLPALSINWGAWSSVGMAAALGDGDRRRLAERGLGVIEPDQGVSILRMLLGRPVAQVAVLPIHWARFVARFGGRVPALFADRVPATVPAAEPDKDVMALIAAAPASKRRGLMQGHVKEQAAKVLGLDPARPIDSLQPLGELGMDSLMAVELRNALGTSLRRALSPTLLFDYPTIAAVADFLLQDLSGPAVEIPPGPARGERAAAIAELKALSDEQAEALLLAELENDED